MPYNTFINALKMGHLYTFISPKISSPLPHHFVFLGYTVNGDLIFNCCTSQFDKRRTFVEKRGLCYSTIVPIPPDNMNNMTDPDNCMCCNNPIVHTIAEFQIICAIHHPIPLKGILSDNHMQQILIGTHNSDMVPEELKIRIPKTIDEIVPELNIYV